MTVLCPCDRFEPDEEDPDRCANCQHVQDEHNPAGLCQVSLAEDVVAGLVLATRLAHRQLRLLAQDANLPPRVASALIGLAEAIWTRPPFHVLQYRAVGLVVVHPLVDLHGARVLDCPVTEAVGLVGPPGGGFGDYRVGLDGDGRLVVGERVVGVR